MNSPRRILKELKTIKNMIERETKISHLTTLFMLLISSGFTLLTLSVSFFAIPIFSVYAIPYLILGISLLGISFIITRLIKSENKKNL